MSDSRHLKKKAGKWAINYRDWPWRNYPTYVTGGTVLLASRTVEPLLAAFQTTPYMPFDDLYLTGICNEKAGIEVYHSDR